MNPANKNILIVIDAVGCSSLSMHTVTELASRLQAGIKALYIEDVNLLNAMSLPFSREVSLHTATVSNIDSTSMMQRFQVIADSIKKQIEEMAVTQRVSISFSSMRGHKMQVIKNRTEEVNMVLIPAVISDSGRKQLQHSGRKVVVVYEERQPSSDDALNIAMTQAANNNYPLFIIVDSEQAGQHVERVLAQYSGYAETRVVDLFSTEEVASLLYRYAPALFVLPEDSCLIKDEKTLQHLTDSLESDILLIH